MTTKKHLYALKERQRILFSKIRFAKIELQALEPELLKYQQLVDDQKLYGIKRNPTIKLQLT